MPGPKSTQPRVSGNRPDPNGNPRKANRKAAARLASRLSEYVDSNPQNKQRMHKPGSQNRTK